MGPKLIFPPSVVQTVRKLRRKFAIRSLSTTSWSWLDIQPDGWMFPKATPNNQGITQGCLCTDFCTQDTLFWCLALQLKEVRTYCVAQKPTEKSNNNSQSGTLIQISKGKIGYSNSDRYTFMFCISFQPALSVQLQMDFPLVIAKVSVTTVSDSPVHRRSSIVYRRWVMRCGARRVIDVRNWGEGAARDRGIKAF